MRARDVRAIGFCVVTTILVFVAALALLKSYLPSLAVAAAYDAYILTRPRMLRVFRRLRGDVDWSGYFKNE